ncbi:tetraacyldisaccharide 4'-kinase [Fulvimonas soli]|jgi:tetraacyldisaccharide 4'-kinase|uniref:Tetraacyldisaccharide 4'-kinase n=1 Tax=Fulvimonas soli TaxID=155197 RepID=A0A316IIE0_9GAMM|nr:tetraacyldisaccharide 4'-kinase [Fulvimonas soli]PWK92949.1 lipid-A-disaccharide kinase [Fulvimonas soli]TNY26571.1 tetraacyldisaccharide 4'-kinase [Fulvimonas soli]
MAIEDTLASAWYGDARPPWWTRPLAALYGGVAACRRRLYGSGLLRSECLPVPVLVVGNLTAGGTGKTPLTIALAEALRERGRRPGVVSRGYGGRRRGPLLLGDEPDPAEVGDEPCLIRAAGVPVAVGRDRPAAARLLAEAGCDVVIADDGLQHYRLARDVEICVVDGARRFGNGRLLPAGPLREPLARLRTVDFVVCNGAAMEGAATMRLEGAEAVALAGGARRPLADFAGRAVHAVAAIGNPQRFFDALRARGIEVIGHAFPDHHAFAPADLAFGDDRPVLMTDKDAVKCRRFAQPHWWRVPVRAELPAGFIEAVAARLEAARKPAVRGGGA